MRPSFTSTRRLQMLRLTVTNIGEVYSSLLHPHVFFPLPFFRFLLEKDIFLSSKHADQSLCDQDGPQSSKEAATAFGARDLWQTYARWIYQ